ncbi:helix-turn-helix transcriptional regulator [Sedimentitalea sp. JM2-8]|uniref:Helix-turn-helix transcriptional regulator n=1 Tax=Sedimentitalea xiamensis TaxID=3050037 RepID=A0ABT7FBS8_9RHOB|nr:helix-turn-helix transcriptional regulator [Sedimentitalea xiamensis]MDK3072563.1 helix-turn-helix transcriptional regulator [Sedimentitalea xiamensis]
MAPEARAIDISADVTAISSQEMDATGTHRKKSRCGGQSAVISFCRRKIALVEELRKTILDIYDAASDPSLWPEALQALADSVDAVGCIVFEWRQHDPGQKIVAQLASSYYDPAVIEGYIHRCHASEAEDQAIFEAHSMRSDGIDLIEDDVIAPSIDALTARSNVVALQRFGILHRAAGLLDKDNVTQARFSLQLGAGRGRLTVPERDRLAELLPHVAKAMNLGRAARELSRVFGGVLSAIDRLGIGICLLDREGRVVHVNEEFLRQIDRFRLFSRTPTGHLRFARPEDQRQFSALLDDALNHGRFGARPRKEAIAVHRDSFLCIEVVPLHTSAEIGTRPFDGVVLYSTDTSRPWSCDVEPMAAVYGLTEAEAEILSFVAAGLTNAQISEARGRSIATINTQVKSVLSKTGCQTRTQLVRLMLNFGTTYLSPPT